MCEPYKKIQNCVAEAITRIVSSLGVSASPQTLLDMLQEPPRPDFGDIALPIPRLSKQLVELCPKIASALISSGEPCIERAECVGSYLNIWIRSDYLVKELLHALSECGSRYGIVKKERPSRVVVEFVSANPVHPLHVGSGRNAVLGDFLARAHELLGDVVERRYYVNDLGLQVAFLVYGYAKLGRPRTPPGMKADHFLGLVYAATSTLLDIARLRKILSVGSESEVLDAKRDLDSLLRDLAKIRDRLPSIVDGLLQAVDMSGDPEVEVKNIMQSLESGDSVLVEVHREVVEMVLSGIRSTLELLGVRFDKWDYESDLVRSGLVGEVMDKACSSPYFTYYKNAPALDLCRLAENSAIRKELSIPISMEVPPLILARSNGTTLYTTRDIAYTLKKFREFGADLVYNVIAIEQALPQAQLRLALHALGYTHEARSLIHYAYEVVNVKGLAMSGRRARYITVDEVMDALISRTREFARSRGIDLPEDAIVKIARSAFRYSMLSVSPRKTLVFDPEQVIEVRSGTSVYLQYTYARANGILSKYGRELDFKKVSNEGVVGKRRELALLIAKFSDVFRKVATELTPEDMIAYLNRLAEVFNSWYDSDQVLGEPQEELRNLKLLLVYGTKVVIENAFRLLGLDVVERL